MNKIDSINFNKFGFTLVELLVVISILAIMIAILIGILNPVALVNKANDSRRKNDLNKIKIAFEAYYNDKGTYPSRNLIKEWNKDENCGREIETMKSYFSKLPCNLNNTHYEIVYVNTNTFKVVTNLDNKKDAHIPPNWYSEGAYIGYADRKNEVNYGVSSSNILWYETVGQIDDICGRDCIEYLGGITKNIINNFCLSGGGVYCFWGQPTGNNYGIVLPGGLAPLPQCYTDRCCNGSGCD